MKFRFWSESTGARGTSRGTSVQPGSSVHTRGWDAGVRVTCRPRERDEFEVFIPGAATAARLTCTWGPSSIVRMARCGFRQSYPPAPQSQMARRPT